MVKIWTNDDLVLPSIEAAKADSLSCTEDWRDHFDNLNIFLADDFNVLKCLVIVEYY